MRYARSIALCLGLVTVLLGTWVAPLDARATAQVDSGLKRALISFASARALSGGISVLQGTQIDIQPGGIGATFAPGQLLAPINELVKNFADLMLLASIAFGIQKALIAMGGHWLISVLLTASALAWAGMKLLDRHSPSWLSRLCVILLMVRFATPVAVLTTDAFSKRYMDADYVASQSAIDATVNGTTKAALPEAAVSDNPGMLEKLKGLVPKVPDFKARFEAMKLAAEQATAHMVKLMVIFLLQTLLMPLLMVWATYALAKSVFEHPRYLRPPLPADQ